MATAYHNTSASAQQPGLRAYIVFDELPLGCAAHIVSERTCPLLHQGEAVVVDVEDRSIDMGDLFVMESGRNSPNGPTRNAVEFQQKSYRIRDDDGEYRDAACWIALFYNELRAIDGSASQAVRFYDGPVKITEPAYFEDRIIGRVVGILEPSFEGPRLLSHAA